MNSGSRKNEALLNKLSEITGIETYNKIVSELAGNRIYFPIGDTGRRKRNQDIKKAFYGGQSVESLACEHEMSYSQIRRIINDPDE